MGSSGTHVDRSQVRIAGSGGRVYDGAAGSGDCGWQRLWAERQDSALLGYPWQVTAEQEGMRDGETAGGHSYERYSWQADRSRYCEKRCKGLARRSRVTSVCATCGGSYEVMASRAEQSEYCGIACAGVSRRGQERQPWSRGRRGHPRQ